MSEPRFVSRDNPTPTGKNLRKFLTIPRDLTAIWNAVPLVIHQPGDKNRVPKVGEIREGARELEGPLALFPRLEVVLVCGHIARKAVPVLENRSLTVLTMPHPSPTFVNTSPLVAEATRHSVKLASTAFGFS